MKYILHIFVFIFSSNVAFAGNDDDFLQTYVCEIYLDYRSDFDDANTIPALASAVYLYARRTEALIEESVDRISLKIKPNVKELARLARERKYHIENTFDEIRSQNLGGLKTMLSDDTKELMLGLFEYYMLDDSRVRQSFNVHDRIDNQEKAELFEIIEKIDPNHALSCRK